MIGLGSQRNPALTILTQDARGEGDSIQENLLSKPIVIYKSNGQVFIPTPSQLTAWVYIMIFNQD